MTRLDSGTDDVLAWTREADGRRLLVVVGFVGETRTVDLAAATGESRWVPCVGSHRQPSAPGPDGRLALQPDEALILEAPAS